MARARITPQTAPGGDVTDGTVLTYTAANVTDKNDMPLTGREILLARNSGATPRNVTINTVADDQGRTGDIADAIAAGAERVYGPFPTKGFLQGGSLLHFEADNAEVLFAAIRLPF